MNETSAKLCLICLKTEKDTYISESSSCSDFFTQIIGVKEKELENKMMLCIWCKSSLKRTVELIELAEESQRILTASNQTNHQNAKRLKKELYQLSYYNNRHVDIPPVSVENNACLDNHEEIEEKNTDAEQDLNEIELNTIEETTNNENSNEMNSNVNDENPKKSKKDINYEEMMFEVKILDYVEQVKEIELKKSYDKYKNMDYHCQDCGLGFLTDDVFKEHNLRHKKEAGPYKCNVCHLRFKSKDVLSQHTLAHKRRFTCLICKAGFKRWGHCLVHRYKCGSLQSPVVCEDCKKVFSDPYSLDLHIKGVHKKEKKHVCEQCGRRFATKQKLHVHKRSHTLTKHFACPTCSRAFSTRSNLRAHAAVHSDTRQHYCVECDTYYKTEKGLRRHLLESVRHLVDEDLVHKCIECSKHFATKKALSSHMDVRHLTSYRCSVCHKKFSNKSNLRKHMRSIH